MTEPHKRAHRHPKYKTAYRVSNWPKYDQALRDRGDITLWIRQAAIDAWTAPKTGRRGAQPVYADIAIETALTLRLLFRLPLRQTEGLLHCSAASTSQYRTVLGSASKIRAAARMPNPSARNASTRTIRSTAACLP
jgi:hypothetical protein